MKPEYIVKEDESKYVFAICKCPLTHEYAIKIPKIKNKYNYYFKCEDCNTEGVVYIGGKY